MSKEEAQQIMNMIEDQDSKREKKLQKANKQNTKKKKIGKLLNNSKWKTVYFSIYDIIFL